MSDSGENSDSRCLKGWALIGNDGEVESEDGDSESSESSIEIVNAEGNDTVSSRLSRNAESEQDGVVVETNSPSAQLVSQHDSVQEQNHGQRMTGAESAQATVPAGGEPGDGLAVPQLPHCSPVVGELVPGIPESGHSERRLMQQVVDGSKGLTVPDPHRDEIVMTTTFEPRLERVDSQPHQASPGNELGACCSAMLASREEHVADSADSRPTSDTQLGPGSRDQLPTEGCDNPEDMDISQPSIASGNSSLNKSDSDTDSDFVRLDSDQPELYQGQENGEGRVVIPLHLGASSSICPSFSFTRGLRELEDTHFHGREFEDRQFHGREFEDRLAPDREYEERQGPERDHGDEDPERDYGDVDEDMDDETESSTEDGVDDRIESEQSEAGSFSAQNDVGDLSVFADIGDLPLEAGNVPRNYIHRPNNHLSMMLNFIVVLAAILTMGISLGIIMATDLEIEEWQSAHESQARRVHQLEQQLQLMNARLERESQTLGQMHSGMRTLKAISEGEQKKTEAHEKLLRYFSLHRPVVGSGTGNVQKGNVQKAILLVREAAQDYVSCMAYSSKHQDCDRKLQPYLNIYSALIVADESGMSFSQSLEDTGFENESDLSTVLKNLQFGDSVNVAEPAEAVDKEEAVESGMEYTLTDQCDFGPEEKTLESREAVSDLPADDHQPAGQAVHALPIELDLKQLQQSLSREQERALHWQQLYLAERRQREKEREEEEWEDERDREMRERDREQLDSVACLKKLMSTNLTTLTQHVARWNVSVFDDFANLSMLLSGVADLKQAVVSSIHKVWEGAEEVMGNMHGKNEEESSRPKSSTQQQKVVEYLTLLLEHVRNGYMPDQEVLVNSLSKMLAQIKDGMDVFRDEGFGFVSGSVERIWEEAEELMHKLQREEKKEEGVDGNQEDPKPVPDQTVLVEYLARALNDIKHGVEDVIENVSAEDYVVHGEGEGESIEFEYEGHSEDMDEEQTSHSMSFYHNERPGEHEELGGNGQGFWSKKIVKILKKTSHTIRKLGRRVVTTWDNIKNVWHEKRPTWQKIKKLWHEKKPGIFNLARHFSSKEMGPFSSANRLCSHLPKDRAQWWNQQLPTVDIHCKSVYKLRKKWQKKMLEDGDNKRQRPQLKELMGAFNELLNIPAFDPKEALQLAQEDLAITADKFSQFWQKWGRSEFLLTTDQIWIKCQEMWWSTVFFKSHDEEQAAVEPNQCDNIQLRKNFEAILSRNIHHHHEKQDVDVVNPYGQLPEMISVFEYDNSESGTMDNSELDFDHVKNDVEDNDDVDHLSDHEANHYHMELNDTSNDTSSQDEESGKWYMERARYRLQLRRERAKADWMFEMAADRQEQRQQNLQQEEDSMERRGFPSGRKLEHEREGDRDMDRKEYHPHDGAGQWKKNMDKEKHHYKRKFDKEHQRSLDSWFMEQAEERQRQRLKEHQADWLFERAADRKHGHQEKQHDHSKYNHHHYHHQKPGKYSRQTYGRVRT